MKKYIQENKAKLSSYKNEWYQNNREEIIADRIIYYQENKDNFILKNKIYRESHKNERNAYEKNRKANDPAYKLRKNFSTRIYIALKGNKNNFSILDYIPYTMEELKLHLESQFDDKMTWDNYGNYWHIDHIVPQSRLLYTSMTDDNFKKCWALSNLRPLEALENIRKSNKIIGDK